MYTLRSEMVDNYQKEISPEEELAIYESLMNGIKLNRPCKSPFREDKNPSFCLYVSKRNNHIYWIDYATGEKGGINEFLQKFNKNINDFNNIKTKSKIFVPKKTIIKVKRIKFEQKHLDYWAQYGISIDTLKKYKVSPIEYFTINEKKIQNKEDTYCYKIFNNFKIYTPLAIDKHNK